MRSQLVLLFIIYAAAVSAGTARRPTRVVRTTQVVQDTTTEPEPATTQEPEKTTTIRAPTTTPELTTLEPTTAEPLPTTSEYPPSDTVHYKEEVHLNNVRQLTFSGINRNAAFTPDGKGIIFQATSWGLDCDQIFMFDLEKGYISPDTMPPMLSTGKGVASSASSYPKDMSDMVLFASTHANHPKTGTRCPKPICLNPEDPLVAEMCKRGVQLQSVDPDYDLFLTNKSAPGSIVQRLTNNSAYDSEATVSPRGDRIVFTSVRKGDLNLWSMNLNGTDVKQLTLADGYDGQATFSQDGTKIVWSASRPGTPAEQDTYERLLKANAIAMTRMEIRMARLNDTKTMVVTNLGRANSNPTFHPDGERIVFASNFRNKGSRQNLFMIHESGNDTTLKQLTFDPEFDSYPVFSPMGSPRRLLFSSARNATRRGEVNLFIADWNESGKNSAPSLMSVAPVLIFVSVTKLLLW